MARISAAPVGEEGLLLRIAKRMSKKRVGAVVEPLLILGRNSWVLTAAGAYEQASSRASSVPEKLKTLVDIKAAMLIGCSFCLDIGSKIGREQGVTEEQLRDLARYRTSPVFSALEKLALDYTVAMTVTPVVVTDELVAALSRHLDARQLVELTAAIAWENWRARVNHAFDVEVHGFTKGEFCPIPELSEAPPTPWRARPGSV
jgi:AhpD family alkylhydroperoxidase